jgi:hypothetical protein
MAYTKQTWVDNDPTKVLSAARMGYIEDGIEAAAATADAAVVDADIADMVESTDVTTIDVLTQAAYDALGTPSSTTLYVIVG